MLLNSVKCTDRKSESFRAQTQKGHHNGISPFVKLKSFDMINGFPLGYLNLVCLGVMKKMIQIWKSKWKCSVIDDINDRILIFSRLMPSEFHRSGRPLTDLEIAKQLNLDFSCFILAYQFYMICCQMTCMPTLLSCTFVYEFFARQIQAKEVTTLLKNGLNIFRCVLGNYMQNSLRCIMFIVFLIV